jgi:hypothetical protein
MAGTDVPIAVPSTCRSFGGRKWPMFGDHGFYGSDDIRCRNVLNR